MRARRHARRTRRVYRRNPGFFEGAGDSELLITAAGIGIAVWLGYQIIQQIDQGIQAAETAVQTAVQSGEQSISNAVTAVEQAPVTAWNAVEGTMSSWWDSLTGGN